MIVMKFGGTSLGSAGAIRKAAAIVAACRAERPVVVVSAHAGVTDQLLALGRDAAAGGGDPSPIVRRHEGILAELSLPASLLAALHGELEDLVRGLRLVGAVSPRALDHLASFGERCSARTVAAAFAQEGLAASAVDAWDLGLRTDGTAGKARPLPDDGRIARALAAIPGVPVITGFVAKDEQGHVTTLGRNGSDWSATLIGAAAGAAEIRIWKDVDGVRTADPRLVPQALPIRTMGFDEACELAAFGSKVLHPATLLPAMARGIPVRVLDTNHPEAPGTTIVAGAPETDSAVRAIAQKVDVALLVVTSQRLAPQHEFLAAAFAELARTGHDPRAVAVSEACVSFAIDDVAADVAAAALARVGEVRVERDRAVVGVIGRGHSLEHGAMAQALATLASAGVGVRCAAQGARGGTLAVVIAETDVRRAVTALHERFFG